MNELEALHPCTIPNTWCKVGQNPFSTIGITKKFYASPHIDSSDTKHSFILWFETSTGRGGKFVFLEWNLFIKPSQDTILLFDSPKIWHYTRGNFGFEQIGVALVLKETIIRKALEKLQRQMKGLSVLIEQRRKIKAEGRKIDKEIKVRKMS